MIFLICISRIDILSGNSLVSVLAANILMTAYRNKTRWPDLFVRVYIEDAIGERVWVDHPESKPFVDNICTAFDTKIPTQNQFASGGFFVGSGGSTGNTTKSSGTEKLLNNCNLASNILLFIMCGICKILILTRYQLYQAQILLQEVEPVGLL